MLDVVLQHQGVLHRSIEAPKPQAMRNSGFSWKPEIISCSSGRRCTSLGHRVRLGCHSVIVCCDGRQQAHSYRLTCVGMHPAAWPEEDLQAGSKEGNNICKRDLEGFPGSPSDTDWLSFVSNQPEDMFDKVPRVSPDSEPPLIST